MKARLKKAKSLALNQAYYGMNGLPPSRGESKDKTGAAAEEKQTNETSGASIDLHLGGDGERDDQGSFVDLKKNFAGNGDVRVVQHAVTSPSLGIGGGDDEDDDAVGGEGGAGKQGKMSTSADAEEDDENAGDMREPPSPSAGVWRMLGNAVEDLIPDRVYEVLDKSLNLPGHHHHSNKGFRNAYAHSTESHRHEHHDPEHGHPGDGALLWRIQASSPKAVR